MLGEPFQPSATYVGKAEAYPRDGNSQTLYYYVVNYAEKSFVTVT